MSEDDRSAAEASLFLRDLGLVTYGWGGHWTIKGLDTVDKKDLVSRWGETENVVFFSLARLLFGVDSPSLPFDMVLYRVENFQIRFRVGNFNLCSERIYQILINYHLTVSRNSRIHSVTPFNFPNGNSDHKTRWLCRKRNWTLIIG